MKKKMEGGEEECEEKDKEGEGEEKYEGEEGEEKDEEGVS